MEHKPILDKKLKDKAEKLGVKFLWDRYGKSLPKCGFGLLGLCCRLCAMGPCRIDPFGEEPITGVCGADADTIAARNWARMVAAGMAAHADHGRHMAKFLISVAKGEIKGYGLKDTRKLQHVAQEYGLSIDGKSPEALAIELGEAMLKDFGSQEGEIKFIEKAPQKRQDIWRKEKVAPRGVDIECVELMHRTHMGTDQDYKNIISQSIRCALADGWGGSMIATELSDIVYGTPAPIRSKINLGALEKEKVNIVVHGHEPFLAESLVALANAPELLNLAKEKGAAGINVAGICCTANEVLMRHGIRPIGSFLHQELALLTGAVDLMVVDVQCIIQALSNLSKCFHTKFVTTSPRAKIDGALHIEVDEKDPLKTVRGIMKEAINNFPKRGSVDIPEEPVDLIAGFSHETVNYMLGGLYRGSYTPLNDNIMNGRILGVAGVVGCDRPDAGMEKSSEFDKAHVRLVRELIAHDVLVVETGCAAHVCADVGLLVPEAAKYAGPGLAEVCKAVGIPPVLHAGSCVDNSRVLVALCEMVKTGGLGDDIGDLPVAGCCPSWISEKAIAIGTYFVASGVFTIFGGANPIAGAKKLSKYLFKDLEDTYKGYWAFEPDPHKMAQLMIGHMKKKREALKLKPVMYEPMAVEV